MKIARYLKHDEFKEIEDGNYEPLLADLTIKYGQEPKIENLWKEVIPINEKQTRQTKINELLDRLEKNSKTNGFFKKDDLVSIDLFHGFKIDDKEIYYLFFNTLEKTRKFLQEQGLKDKDNFAIFLSIKETIDLYFGKDKISHNRERFHFTEILADEEIPSIKRFKNSGFAMCAEKSSVAHNLWLLCGKKSYYIVSKFIEVSVENHDAHAFCIVEYDGKFRIFDPALGNYGMVQGNPIELIKSNKQFAVKDKNIDIVYVMPSQNNLTID